MFVFQMLVQPKTSPMSNLCAFHRLKAPSFQENRKPCTEEKYFSGGFGGSRWFPGGSRVVVVFFQGFQLLFLIVFKPYLRLQQHLFEKACISLVILTIVAVRWFGSRVGSRVGGFLAPIDFIRPVFVLPFCFFFFSWSGRIKKSGCFMILFISMVLCQEINTRAL